MRTSVSMSLFLRCPTLLALCWRRWGRQDRERSLSRRRKVSFVVFRLDALGDVVMTTPIFRELKRSFPDAHCTVVVQEAHRCIFATNADVDEILTVPASPTIWLPHRAKALLSAIIFWRKRLRGRKFDIAISPRWDTDEHLATFLCVIADAGARVGYTENTSPGKRLLNRGFQAAFDAVLPAGSLQHEVLRNLAIVEALDGAVEDSSLDIRLSDRDRRNAGEILHGVSSSAVLVALGIGASSRGRCWPLERFAEVIWNLEQKFTVQPVIVCSSAERKHATALAKQLNVPPIIAASPQLRHTCAILKRCDLFVGNDSGPAHLAAAMDCRTIVISRHPLSGDPSHPNSPLRFAPYCRECRVLQPAYGLDTCRAACISREPHCITAVSVRDVTEAAMEMLASRSAPTSVSRVFQGNHALV